LLVIQLRNALARGLELFRREYTPQVLDDAQDLGDGNANRQVATPVTAFSASKTRWRVCHHALLNGFLRQLSGLCRDRDDLQRCSAGFQRLGGPQALGTSGAQFGLGDAPEKASAGRFLLSGATFACFVFPTWGSLVRHGWALGRKRASAPPQGGARGGPRPPPPAAPPPPPPSPLRPAGPAGSEILDSGGDCEQVGRAEQLVKDRQIHARIRLGRDHGKPATGRGAARGGERSGGGSAQTNRRAGAGEAQRRSAEP